MRIRITTLTSQVNFELCRTTYIKMFSYMEQQRVVSIHKPFFGAADLHIYDWRIVIVSHFRLPPQLCSIRTTALQ